MIEDPNMKKHNEYEGDIPLVSIIVPVFNTASYLTKCVESLLSQSYARLEILLIDDGSTDDCPYLIDQYASENENIIVVHKSNGGSSSARKEGLRHATGDYIMFVDGDDWIDSGCVKACVDTAERDRSDCVMFGYVKEYQNSSIAVRLFDDNAPNGGVDFADRIHRRIIGPIAEELRTPERIDSFSPICMKLYRAETAKRGRIISERTVGTSEDTVFNIYALEGCRISLLNECYYHYRKGNTSSITAKYKADLLEKWDVLYDIIAEYVEQHSSNKQYTEAMLNRVACGMIGLGLNEIRNKTDSFSLSKRLKNIVSKPLYRKAFKQLKTKYCPVRWKLFFTACKYKLGVLLVLLLKIMEYLRSRVSV